MTQPRNILNALAREADTEFARQRRHAFATWSWVEHSAAKVWSAPHPEGQREALVALACAVGNFKRQTPISLGREAPELTTTRRSTSIQLTGLEPPVVVDESPESVGALTRVHGISTATATAVLAALFPDHHAIMDSRSAPVAAAWARALELDVPGPHHDDSRALVSDRAYVHWYHGVVKTLAHEAAVTIRDIERVCFLTDIDRRGHGSWRNFATSLVDKGQHGWSQGR